MTEHYNYTKKEITFILHQLNDDKLKGLLSLARNKMRDDFIVKCVDIARAFSFLDYNQQSVLRHLFFYKETPGLTSWKLSMDKEKVYFIKRNGLKLIYNILNGHN